MYALAKPFLPSSTSTQQHEGDAGSTQQHEHSSTSTAQHGHSTSSAARAPSSVDVAGSTQQHEYSSTSTALHEHSTSTAARAPRSGDDAGSTQQHEHTAASSVVSRAPSSSCTPALLRPSRSTKANYSKKSSANAVASLLSGTRAPNPAWSADQPPADPPGSNDPGESAAVTTSTPGSNDPGGLAFASVFLGKPSTAGLLVQRPARLRSSRGSSWFSSEAAAEQGSSSLESCAETSATGLLVQRPAR